MGIYFDLPLEARTILAKKLNDIHFTIDGQEFIITTSSCDDIKQKCQVFGGSVVFECQCSDVFDNKKLNMFFNCEIELFDRLFKENIYVTIVGCKVVETTIGNKCLDSV